MVKVLFIIFFIFNSPKSFSSQIKIALPLMPNWSSLDQTGFIDELLILLRKNGLKDFETIQYPLKRSILSFKQDRTDCVAGGNKKLAKQYTKEIIIESDPVFKTDISLYLPKDHKHKHISLQLLKNKSIGVLRGFTGSFSHLIKNREFKIVEGNSIDQLILMLKRDRIQAIIYNGTSLSPENRKVIDYKRRVTLMSYLNRIMCKENKRNLDFIKGFNKNYSQVLKTKEYSDLYFRKYQRSSPFIKNQFTFF